MKKNCIVCAKEFEAKKETQKACSLYCWNMNRKKNKLPTFHCARCRKEFTKEQSQRRKTFCSISCASSRKGRWSTGRGHIIICKQCGKEYKALPFVEHHGVRKFCSRKCVKEYKYRNRNNYDDSFLDIESEFRSYFVGLFMADGSFNMNRTVKISSSDGQLILDLADRLDYRNSFSTKKPDGKGLGKKEHYTLGFYGRFVDKFERLGFTPGRKAHRLVLPACVSDTTFQHFLRGFIDGDGSMILHRQKLRHDKIQYYLNCCVYSLSQKFLYVLLDKLQQMKIVFGGDVYKHNTIYRLQFGQFDSVALGAYIYKDSTIRLERKYKKYLAGASYQPQIERQAGKFCIVDDCNKPARSCGRCHEHYHAWYRATHKEQIKRLNENYRKSHKEELRVYMRKYRALRAGE